jgi:hypothetical protein
MTTYALRYREGENELGKLLTEGGQVFDDGLATHDHVRLLDIYGDFLTATRPVAAGMGELRTVLTMVRRVVTLGDTPGTAALDLHLV